MTVLSWGYSLPCDEKVQDWVLLYVVDSLFVRYHCEIVAITLKTNTSIEQVLGSIVVSIPACHAGDRGSIPRRGDFLKFQLRILTFIIQQI
jgi:hypothetical protein